MLCICNTYLHQTPQSHLSFAADEEFKGFVLKGGSSRPALPGPLPRYGESSGRSFMLADVATRDIVGICRAKIKVVPESVLSEGGSGLAVAVMQLQKVQVSNWKVSHRVA